MAHSPSESALCLSDKLQALKSPRDGSRTLTRPAISKGFLGYDAFPVYPGVMHELHRQAAEHHKLAAQAHRTAAEHNEKGDNETANWHSQRALEYSNRAYELAKEAHNKSGRIETLS